MTRRKFSREFKIEAVRLVTDRGVAVAQAARGLVAAFAPQDPPGPLLSLSLQDAVRDALDAGTAETEGWRVDIVLDDLAVDHALRSRTVRDLSGGWQRVMLLARAAVTEPDLLLLDEPTNHLDIGRIGVLQRFLAALPRDCAVVAASHDRAFLDDATTRTLFLRPRDSADFALPYSHARRALDEQDAARDRQFGNDMRKVRALRQQAAKLKNIGINSGTAVEDRGRTVVRMLKGTLDEGVLRIEPGMESIDRGIPILSFDFLDETDPHRTTLTDEILSVGWDALEHLVDLTIQFGGLELFDGMITVFGIAYPGLVFGPVADKVDFKRLGGRRAGHRGSPRRAAETHSQPLTRRRPPSPPLPLLSGWLQLAICGVGQHRQTGLPLIRDRRAGTG